MFWIKGEDGHLHHVTACSIGIVPSEREEGKVAIQMIPHGCGRQIILLDGQEEGIAKGAMIVFEDVLLNDVASNNNLIYEMG